MSISGLLQILKTDASSMSLGEKLLGGIVTAILAMIIVFIVLTLIAFIIRAINYKKELDITSNIENKIEKIEEEVGYDEEIVAVITAAIIASSSKNIAVKKISRSNNIKSNWEKTSKI